MQDVGRLQLVSGFFLSLSVRWVVCVCVSVAVFFGFVFCIFPKWSVLLKQQRELKLMNWDCCYHPMFPRHKIFENKVSVFYSARNEVWTGSRRGGFVAQSCPILCDPMDCSSLGSSVHGILQARILEWVTIPFSRGSSQPRDGIQVSCTAGRFFITWTTRGKNERRSS